MKNKIAIVCRLFFGVAVAVCLALGVSAQDALGILTLDCHIPLESGVRPLAGDTYALVPVADAVVEEGPAISYTTRPEFAAFDCNWAAQNGDCYAGYRTKVDRWLPNWRYRCRWPLDAEKPGTLPVFGAARANRAGKCRHAGRSVFGQRPPAGGG